MTRKKGEHGFGGSVKYDKEKMFYAWNQQEDKYFPRNVEINDETLRDGIQASGISQPSLPEKLKILDYIHLLGIEAACIGFPAAGPAMMKDLEGMIRHIQKNNLNIRIACAARTVEKDIAPIVELSQKFGVSIDANVFVGSSPMRQVVEHWDMKHICDLARKAVTFGVKNNVPVNFITEDTTRSRPEDIRAVYEAAVECGAYRVCLCDTVGYASPGGTEELIRFVKGFVHSHNPGVCIDWHGHNDRGLAMANAMTALRAGVNCVHGTCLGIGERSGNVPMEQLLMNLKLKGVKRFDAVNLKNYCYHVSKACDVAIPGNLPIVGGKAFATATGVHAAAIIKAKNMEDQWLADNIYSAVPAGELGLPQVIEVGPLSGKSNVTYFLHQHHIEDQNLGDDIYKTTKEKGRTLTDDEIGRLFSQHGYQMNNYHEKERR